MNKFQRFFYEGYVEYEKLINYLSNFGATEFIFKELSENDNSKNQIYLGGSYEALQEIPHGEIEKFSNFAVPNYKAKLDYWWLDDEGNLSKAPCAQLILYPKYPEVRLSGFLKNCKNPPSEYFKTIDKMSRKGEKDGRVLIFSFIAGRVIAYLAPKDSPISLYLRSLDHEGVFGRIELSSGDSRNEIIKHLKHEVATNPHEKVRMYSDGSIKSYAARNAAGYTLEASFGIIPNGSPEPDYKGWELKCYSKSLVTLMTPEPDGGIYYEIGARKFIEKFGHLADDGKMYFTGPYRVIETKKFNTSRKLVLEGYDMIENKIFDVDGALSLIQEETTKLASWSFSHILNHWGKKHNKACYVQYKKDETGRISYSPIIFLGEGTSPILLLRAILANIVYYDPGARIDKEGILKPRSQFRIKPKDLHLLYEKSEYIDVSKI